MKNNDWLTHIKNSPVAAINKHITEVKEEHKKSKYNNQIVEFDGYSFRSKKELGRYISLRALEKAGQISELKLQVPFQLNDGGKFSCEYVCDFAYIDVKTGKYVVEDTKGKRTKLFEKKCKLMQKIHHIFIKIS